MRSAARVIPALLLALVCACGPVGEPSGGAPHSSPSPPVQTSTSPSPRDLRAEAVTYTRSGGKGWQQRRSARITPGSAPRGYDRARVRAILRAASTPALRTLRLPLMPQIVCCDRYVYTIEVTWADGTHRTFRTADGLRQPPQLRRLLMALA
jgi:hypothetical protein